MSKKLLMNNVISGGNVNKCPVCGEAENKCTCIPIEADQLTLDWVTAFRYQTSSIWVYDYDYTATNNGDTYISIFNYSIISDFRDKMIELGYLTTGMGGTDFHFYNNRVYWNNTKNHVDDIIKFKGEIGFMKNLTDEQLQNIKDYGKCQYTNIEQKILAKVILGIDPNIKRGTNDDYLPISSSTKTVNGVTTYQFRYFGSNNTLKNKIIESLQNNGFIVYDDVPSSTPTDTYFAYINGDYIYISIQPIKYEVNFFISHQDLLT